MRMLMTQMMTMTKCSDSLEVLMHCSAHTEELNVVFII